MIPNLAFNYLDSFEEDLDYPVNYLSLKIINVIIFLLIINNIFRYIILSKFRK